MRNFHKTPEQKKFAFFVEFFWSCGFLINLYTVWASLGDSQIVEGFDFFIICLIKVERTTSLRWRRFKGVVRDVELLGNIEFPWIHEELESFAIVEGRWNLHLRHCGKLLSYTCQYLARSVSVNERLTTRLLANFTLSNHHLHVTWLAESEYAKML